MSDLDTVWRFCYHSTMKRSKDETLRVRLDPSTMKLWRAAATQSGLSLSQWVRMRCNGVAVVVAHTPRQAA